MESWRFVSDRRSELWSWRLVDDDTASVRKCSAEEFLTLQGCIADAIEHGYLPDRSDVFIDKRQQ
jgi:hypothetical protein